MVTVDMSTTRAQITKRQRRMRRATQRRLQRQQKAYLRDLHSAKAAREARQRAIASWNAEEERLQRLRDTQQNTSDRQNYNGPTPRARPRVRAVKFAEQVMVTEIPIRDAEKLPKPVSSPIGVSICGTDDDSDTKNDSSKRPSQSITFSQLAEGAFADDDDDDPEFAPDDPSALKVPLRPVQRPRRRIVAKRLDVPLEHIIPSKNTKRSKLALAPKRPRPETRLSSKISSSHAPTPSPQNETNGPETNDKRTPEERSCQEQKQSTQRDPSTDASSLPRLRNKRKRLRSARNDEQADSERHTTSIVPESKNKTGSTAPQFHENATERQEKPRRTKKKRPSLEKRAPSDKSEKALLTSSNAKAVDQDLSSSQNGQALTAPKNGAQSSTFVANGHLKQNGHKLNGFHDKPEKKGQKPSDSDDEKDLDNMFGALVRRKAANCALKGKMSRQEKRPWEENGLEQSDQPRKKKFKKGPVRYTEDGLRIMTYEEIAADQPSGLTGDCPFDCSCCF